MLQKSDLIGIVDQNLQLQHQKILTALNRAECSSSQYEILKKNLLLEMRRFEAEADIMINDAECRSTNEHTQGKLFDD
jgi:hypothetical protein